METIQVETQTTTNFISQRLSFTEMFDNRLFSSLFFQSIFFQFVPFALFFAFFLLLDFTFLLSEK